MDPMHDHDHEHEENDAETAKIVAMCCLFLCSMILGLLPIKLSQWLKWKSSAGNNTYVQLLLCFGGGVLLSTTFLHMVPEVEENVEKIEDLQNDYISVAPLLMCAGFFIMYFVEELVHCYIHNKETPQFKSARSSISISRGDFGKSQEPQEYHHHLDHSHVDHSHLVMQDTTIITIRGLLVVLALSIHELFEGLAVGLESSSAHVWYMFGGISAHKLVIAFCIGIELVSSGMKTLFVVVYVLMFAVVSPIGIGIGIAVTEEEKSTTLVSVILQGLASGTLLYVVFFEILRDGMKKGLLSFFAILCGFVVMLGFKFIGEHEH